MKISIIVPCYNEADNIPLIINQLHPVLKSLVSGEIPGIENLEVIYVDDGSQDDTYLLLQEITRNSADTGILFKIERHEVNRGLGAALRTGFNAAAGDVIITVDSDGTYKYTGIPDLLALLTPEIDIVTASPYHPDGGVEGVPPNRLLLSRGSSLIYRLLLDSKVHTYTSLFRAYRLAVIESISFKSDGYLAGTELMVKAMLQGYRVAEFPSVLHRRKYGVSKAKIAQTIVAHLRFQWQLLLHQLRINRLVEPAPNTVVDRNSI